MPSSGFKPLGETPPAEVDLKGASNGVFIRDWEGYFSFYSSLPTDVKRGLLIAEAAAHRIKGGVQYALLVKGVKEGVHALMFPNEFSVLGRTKHGFVKVFRTGCFREHGLQGIEHFRW